MPNPKITAIGVGPGDPELITVKGTRAIAAADIVFVPRSRDGGSSIALQIAEPYIDRTRQSVIELSLPMTRNSNELIPAWQAAADQMAANLSDEQPNGVYLLLGDPLLYGTFTYIWAELAERYPHIDIHFVPGITSFAAAAAHAQIPLGTTSDRVAILPGSYEDDPQTLRDLLTRFDTIILMKAGPVLPQLIAELRELDLLDHAVYAERVGMPNERVVTDLRTLPAEPAPYLSLLIVRK